jgi:hypothetical protein
LLAPIARLTKELGESNSVHGLGDGKSPTSGDFVTASGCHDEGCEEKKKKA